jgi:hypothetical protein
MLDHWKEPNKTRIIASYLTIKWTTAVDFEHLVGYNPLWEN